MAKTSFALTGFLVVLGFLFKVFAEKRSDKGAQEAANWQAFKNYMKAYQKTKQYPIDSIIFHGFRKHFMALNRVISQ